METRRIEFIKPQIEDKTSSQINFGCSIKYGGPVIADIDLDFAKICLRSANVQKVFEKLFFLMS